MEEDYSSNIYSLTTEGLESNITTVDVKFIKLTEQQIAKFFSKESNYKYINGNTVHYINGKMFLTIIPGKLCHSGGKYYINTETKWWKKRKMFGFTDKDRFCALLFDFNMMRSLKEETIVLNRNLKEVQAKLNGHKRLMVMIFISILERKKI